MGLNATQSHLASGNLSILIEMEKYSLLKYETSASVFFTNVHRPTSLALTCIYCRFEHIIAKFISLHVDLYIHWVHVERELTFRSHESHGISWQAEWLLASQKWISSMELISCIWILSMFYTIYKIFIGWTVCYQWLLNKKSQEFTTGFFMSVGTCVFIRLSASNNSRANEV
jgi:hypothetical protein